MPLIVHPSSSCDICTEPFNDSNAAPCCVPGCGHVFCETCLRGQKTCPICRKRISGEGARKLYVETRAMDNQKKITEEYRLLRRIVMLDSEDEDRNLRNDVQRHMNDIPSVGQRDDPVSRAWTLVKASSQVQEKFGSKPDSSLNLSSHHHFTSLDSIQVPAFISRKKAEMGRNEGSSGSHALSNAPSQHISARPFVDPPSDTVTHSAQTPGRGWQENGIANVRPTPSARRGAFARTSFSGSSRPISRRTAPRADGNSIPAGPTSPQPAPPILSRSIPNPTQGLFGPVPRV